MHCRTRDAGMTWNAYYRDKMNQVVGIRPIRIDDAHFATAATHFPLARSTLDHVAVFQMQKSLHIHSFER